MIYTAALILISLAAVTAIVAAVRKDHKMFLATGIILFILAAALFNSGLQIPDGKNITKQEIDTNTTEITETVTYTDLETSAGFENISQYIAIALIGITLYAVFMGSLVPYKKKLQRG